MPPVRQSAAAEAGLRVAIAPRFPQNATSSRASALRADRRHSLSRTTHQHLSLKRLKRCAGRLFLPCYSVLTLGIPFSVPELRGSPLRPLRPDCFCAYPTPPEPAPLTGTGASPRRPPYHGLPTLNIGIVYSRQEASLTIHCDSAVNLPQTVTTADSARLPRR